MRGSQVRTLSGTQKFSKTERLLPKNGYFCSVKLKQALLAQLVVAVVLHTTGHRFESCRVYKKGELSNWLAQRTVNPSSYDLGGSSPSSPTSEKCRFESVSSLIGKTTLRGDGGSNPPLV